MKLRTIAPTLVAVLALLGWAATAPAGEYDLSFSGGFSMPSGDFSDELDAETGPLFGVDVHYHFSPSVALGVDVSWMRNKHSGEGDTVILPGGESLTAEKDRFNTIHYGVHGKYFFSTEGSLDPWVVLGLGFYNVKNDYEYILDDGVTAVSFTDENENLDQPGSRFGYRVGAGVTYMTSPKMGIGLGFDYNSFSMDEDEFGVSSLPFMSILGRITFRLGN